jgi:hypothetical protein
MNAARFASATSTVPVIRIIQPSWKAALLTA